MNNYVDFIETFVPVLCLCIGVGTGVWYEFSRYKERILNSSKVQNPEVPEVIEIEMPELNYAMSGVKFHILIAKAHVHSKGNSHSIKNTQKVSNSTIRLFEGIEENDYYDESLMICLNG